MRPNIFISNTSKNRLVLIIVSVFVIQFLAMCFSGCTDLRENDVPQLEQEEFQEYQYVIKDEKVNIKQIALYYPDKNHESSVRVVSEVRVYEGSNELSLIINKWLSNIANEDAEYTNAFNGKIGLEWVTVSRNLATINLRGNFETMDDLMFYSGIVSLVNTVCEVKGIEYVEILINGKQLPNAGLLKSPMTEVTEKLKLSYLEHLDSINNAEESVTSKENTIFYYLDIKSNYLIADVSNVTIAKGNAVEEIFKLLKSGPNYDSGMKSCIPQSMVLNSGNIENETGETVLTLRLEMPTMR